MSSSLKEYLKKYESNASDDKKKKKKKKTKAVASGVLVVDEDPVWQKQVQLEEEEENDSPDEKPQVDEDIEVKRMKRLEILRARRSYNEISEDGSGWVPISDVPKSSTSYDQSSDISPPLNRKARFDTPSPEAGREVTDLSPPRQRRQRNDTPSPRPDADLSPPRQRYQRKDTPDGDLSPPRQRRQRKDIPSPAHDGDLSPPRQRRQRKVTPSPGSDGDLSPPRPRKKLSDSSLSKHGSKSSDINNKVDLSPPRHRRQRYDSPSPERRTKASNADKDSDISPPRRRGRGSSSRSPMPQKKFSVSGIKDSDLDDLSPPRRQSLGSLNLNKSRDLDDLSPPRKSQKGSDMRVHRENNTISVEDRSPPRKRKEQPKRGLITGKDVGEEVAKSKKDQWSRFNEMDPSTSGRAAEPVFRNKEGARVSKDEYLKLTKKENQKTKEEKKLEWAKGLAQKREAEARLLELELEKEKPFARSRDDSELDTMMKDRVRWGDPMAHLVKKKQPELHVSDFGEDEKMKESGFIIPQDIPSHSWLKRGLDYEPNRYGIKPGRHWDGVNRSTGYEKQLFKRMNEKRATEREAYLWSVSDM